MILNLIRIGLFVSVFWVPVTLILAFIERDAYLERCYSPPEPTTGCERAFGHPNFDGRIRYDR